jgi:hypothetical protein
MQKLIAIAAGMAVSATWMAAQSNGPVNSWRMVTQFQQFGTVGSPGEAAPMTLMRTQGRAWGSLIVEGKPFSATQERHTTQTLGDGTRIEQSDSNLFYRDPQGRTRVEQTYQGKTTIVIMDPVARFVARLDPATLTASKTNFGEQVTVGGVAIEQGAVSMGLSSSTTDWSQSVSPVPVTMTARGGGVGGGLAGRGGGRGGRGMADTQVKYSKPQVEELGAQPQNGVLAQGTRSTITIPAGEIGNDRDLHVVNERWYSNDLQMLIKSSNSDPRFGTTTYQLTNIVRSAPDPGLFLIPGAYTVNETGPSRIIR